MLAWKLRHRAPFHAILFRRRDTHMPLVSMRQLLDEAAKGGYGVGAFNVNNMEQIQAIMEAATRNQVARDHAGQPRRAFLFAGSLPVSPDDRGHRTLSRDSRSCCTRITATASPPASRAIDMGFTSVMMDGSLMEDGKTPSSFEYNVKVTREVVELAHAKGVTVEGEIGCLGGIEDGHGAGGRRPGAPDRSGSGRGVREADRRGCAGGRHRHQPRRLQVQQQADRRDAEDGRA